MARKVCLILDLATLKNSWIRLCKGFVWPHFSFGSEWIYSLSSHGRKSVKRVMETIRCLDHACCPSHATSHIANRLRSWIRACSMKFVFSARASNTEWRQPDQEFLQSDSFKLCLDDDFEIWRFGFSGFTACCVVWYLNRRWILSWTVVANEQNDPINERP